MYKNIIETQTFFFCEIKCFSEFFHQKCISVLEIPENQGTLLHETLVLKDNYVLLHFSLLCIPLIDSVVILDTNKW